jgi:hypothetical protein
VIALPVTAREVSAIRDAATATHDAAMVSACGGSALFVMLMADVL